MKRPFSFLSRSGLSSVSENFQYPWQTHQMLVLPLLLLPSRFSRVRLFTTPWAAAYQAPPPMGFSRQEYWSGVPLPRYYNKGAPTRFPKCPPPGDGIAFTDRQYSKGIWMECSFPDFGAKGPSEQKHNSYHLVLSPKGIGCKEAQFLPFVTDAG